MSKQEVPNEQKERSNYQNLNIEILIKQNKSIFNEL